MYNTINVRCRFDLFLFSDDKVSLVISLKVVFWKVCVVSSRCEEVGVC